MCIHVYTYMNVFNSHRVTHLHHLYWGAEPQHFRPVRTGRRRVSSAAPPLEATASPAAAGPGRSAPAPSDAPPRAGCSNWNPGAPGATGKLRKLGKLGPGN